jgi:hypothetical protein
MGIEEAAWEEFLRTGEPPLAANRVLTRKDLLRLAHGTQARLTREEGEAMLASLTGMSVADLKEWVRARPELWPGQPGGEVTVQMLADAFRALRESGSLDEAALVLIRTDEQGVASRAPENDIVLYEGVAGTHPDEQGWWCLAVPYPGQAAVTMTNGSTGLDTTGVMADKTGFFTEDPVSRSFLRHPEMPVLDRHRGFTLHLDLRVLEERHVRDDRAGLSLLVVCDDLKALELGFWEHRVWVQSDRGKPLFRDSRAESGSVDTSKASRYDLFIRGDQYEVLAEGRPVLAGQLRDYTRFGDFPYNAANLLFLGDNTTSAAAQMEWARMSISLEPMATGTGGGMEGGPYVPVKERTDAQQESGESTPATRSGMRTGEPEDGTTDEH